MSSKVFYLLFLFFVPILFVQNSEAPKSTAVEKKFSFQSEHLVDSLYKTVIEFDSVKYDSKIKFRILQEQQVIIKKLNP